MSDPLRTDQTRAHDAAPTHDRDAKLEQLLLPGLAYYFAARSELAINVWTRALFLDRSHARARAYIERARGAQAERQREGGSRVHEGAAAIRRGDCSEARRLVDAARARGGGPDEVLALLERGERLELSVRDAIVDAEVFESPRLVLEEPARRSPFAWAALAGFVVVIIAAG